MTLAEKLRNLREERNWSQETVAKMMKIGRSTISRYETGMSTPNLETLLGFAEIYRVDKEYLLGEKNRQPSGFQVEENRKDDPELAIIHELFKVEPELKKALVELYLVAPKQRGKLAKIMVYTVKAGK